MNPDSVRRFVLEEMDRKVRDMSREEYLETMELITEDLEIRIEGVKQEIDEQE